MGHMVSEKYIREVQNNMVAIPRIKRLALGLIVVAMIASFGLVILQAQLAKADTWVIWVASEKSWSGRNEKFNVGYVPDLSTHYVGDNAITSIAVMGGNHLVVFYKNKYRAGAPFYCVGSDFFPDLAKSYPLFNNQISSLEVLN